MRACTNPTPISVPPSDEIPPITAIEKTRMLVATG
jgi:hypothetical protein